MGFLGRLRGGKRAAPDFEAEAGESAEPKISHALVLPDKNFKTWYAAVEPYTKAFSRVAVVRSPAGNDLNRYRNITAVETPGVWLNDDALGHIRRVYRSVVRVDTLKVSSASSLKKILQKRIDSHDRYGELLDDGHIDDRFVLDWPADAMPARIVQAFNADTGGDHPNEGVDIYAPTGTTIHAPISGTVALVVTQPTALGYGQYVQIGTIHQGIHYLVALTHLNKIRVKSGQTVKAGDVLGVSDWGTVRLVVQSPGRGLTGYVLPHVVDPTDMIYWSSLRLRPTDNGLRVRKRPGTAFEIVGQVNMADDCETLEMHGRTLVKVGRDGQWLNVRAPNGMTGYSAAWFLQAVAPELVDRTRLTGVNLDLFHHLGRPAPSRLGQLGWVRLTYNVSYNPQNNTFGNTDLVQAYTRYRPFIEQYARAGYKVIVVLTHQTYGEGAGFNWNRMDDNQWNTLTLHFVDMVREIARQYAGKDLIHVYQIWNEQDARPDMSASVSMPPGTYAFLLGESIRAIRAVDSTVRVISGGHTGGPGTGAPYARSLVRALPPGITLDGIAFHSYGRGATPGLPYAPFGSIDDEIDAYASVLPGKPLWMTEWGVLDHPNDPAADIARYASEMVQRVRLKYAGKLAAMNWFAWAQSMHNGYGLVGTDDQPRQPLYDQFLSL